MNGPGIILSIIISSRNQLNSLRFTLLALRDQMPNVPTEIIVVDNASHDGTAQFLIGEGENGALRVHINTENLGRTRARNAGAKVSKGRFLMFLDPGMIPGPGWWLKLISTLQMDPQVGAVAGKIIIQDGRIDHAGLAVLEWGSSEGGKLTGRSINAGKQAAAGVGDRSLHVQGVAGEAMMVRASAFFAAGGFNTYLGVGHNVVKPLAEAEPAGLDLSLRLKERGWQCVFRSESIMTRLRLSESTSVNSVNTSDQEDLANFTDNWLGKVRPDFIVIPGKGATPTSCGAIRPYVEPVISYRIPGKSGMVNHDLKSRPTASIIVLTHNALSYTRRCIESLLDHTEKHHELILVDNASTDRTPHYLQELAAEHSQIRIILNEKNLGLTGGSNVGMAAAEGDNIVLLNSDVVVTAGWLDKLLDAAEKNPRAGLLGPMANNVTGSQRISLLDYDEKSMRGLAEFAATMAHEHNGELQKTTRLSGFCLLIKRELMARIGGLDECFGLGKFEDNDYCLRALIAGYEMLIVPSCFVHHFGSKSYEASGIDMEEQLLAQWDVFKVKWSIPETVGFTEPVDMRRILSGGFRPSSHFCALPGALRDASFEPVKHSYAQVYYGK